MGYIEITELVDGLFIYQVRTIEEEGSNTFKKESNFYNEDGEILVSSLNGLLTLDKENLTYEISCRSFYKTAKYKYTIPNKFYKYKNNIKISILRHVDYL